MVFSESHRAAAARHNIIPSDLSSCVSAGYCCLDLPLPHGPPAVTLSRCCRFQFEPDALEVVIAGKEEQETENKFVGGRNR